MWGGFNKVWTRYTDDLIASDKQSAYFLETFTHRMRVQKTFVYYFEIIDMQRYKVIRKPRLVTGALEKVNKVPFIFLVGKN